MNTKTQSAKVNTKGEGFAPFLLWGPRTLSVAVI